MLRLGFYGLRQVDPAHVERTDVCSAATWEVHPSAVRTLGPAQSCRPDLDRPAHEL